MTDNKRHPGASKVEEVTFAPGQQIPIAVVLAAVSYTSLTDTRYFGTCFLFSSGEAF